MGILVLGAVLVGLGVFVFFVFLAWKLWRESGRRPGGRNFSDYAVLSIFLPIPLAILYPAFPGFWIAISQCRSAGGEQVYQHVRTDGYAVAWSRLDSHQYDFERLALDLIERKIAYVEILGSTRNQLLIELTNSPNSQSGAARRRQLRPSSATVPNMRFFLSESGATNCIQNRVTHRALARYQRVQEKLGLPETLCVAAETILESDSKYSVVYVEETELIPAPMVWKVLRLKRESDGRTMAEDRGFWYRPYGPGLLSAFVGTLAGGSLQTEGLRCEMKSTRGGLFMQGLQGARERYLLDSRIRSSPDLVKFYAL